MTQKIFSFRESYPYIAIFLLCFLIYFQALFFGFVDYDDKHLIVENQEYLTDPGYIFNAFVRDVFNSNQESHSKSYYRPLLTLSFMLETRIGGISPGIYHFTNILLHFIASCLIYFLLIQLTYKRDLSLIFTLIFVSHPVLSQAVAWIPGRNDSILAIFFLSAFLFFIKFLDSNQFRHYILHLLFCILALFTKESAMAMYVVFLSFIILIHKGKKLKSLTLIKLISGWIVVSGVWFYLYRIAITDPKADPLNLIKTVFSNLVVLVHFLGKIFFPLNLSVFPVKQDTEILYGILAIYLIIFLLFLKRKSIKTQEQDTPKKDENQLANTVSPLKFITFGFIWFFVFLIPALATVFDVHHEHRVYVSLIGILIIILEILRSKNLANQKKIIKIAGTSLILVFSILTVYHSKNFKNGVAFWENAVKTSPSSADAHLMLGSRYILAGNLNLAGAAYREAIKLSPEEKLIRFNLARIYEKQKKWSEAEREYLEEIKINPDDPKVNFHLANVYAEQGNFSKAEELWKLAVELDPDFNKAYENLAVMYLNQNKIQQAKKLIPILKEKKIILPPHLQNILYFDETVLKLKNQIKEDPKKPMIHNELAVLYAQKKMYSEAENEFKRELQNDPNNATVLFNLGYLYLNWNKESKAEKIWLKTIKVDPNFLRAYQKLANLYRQQKKMKQADYYLKLLNERRGRIQPKQKNLSEFDRAVFRLRLEITKNPRKPMLHNNLAVLYAKQKMFIEAEKEFLAELKNYPKNATVHFNLGFLYLNWQKPGKAEEQWKKTIKINPDFLKAYEYLATLYINQNRKDLAVMVVEKLQKKGAPISVKLRELLKKNKK